MDFTKLLVQPHWAFDDSGDLPELLGFLWAFVFVLVWVFFGQAVPERWQSK